MLGLFDVMFSALKGLGFEGLGGLGPSMVCSVRFRAFATGVKWGFPKIGDPNIVP